MHFCIKLLFAGLFLFIFLSAPAQQTPLHKVQAADTSARAAGDSLTKSYTHVAGQLHKKQHMLQHKADSLRRLGQPVVTLQHKIDSVQKTINSQGEKYKQRISRLQQKTQKLKLPGQASRITDKLAKPINNTLPTTSLPSVNPPSTHLNIPQANVPSLPSAPSMPGSAEMKEIQQITSLKNTKDIEKQARKEAEKILSAPAGIAGVPSAESIATEITGNTPTPSAKNHFAGKENQLKTSIDKLNNYKNKLESVNDVKEFVKKHRNEMKDKPLIERLRPGISLQITKSPQTINTDLNLYTGYRLSGKITAGLGWNQHLVYNAREHNFTGSSHIFGPRAYGEYNLGKGFHPRIEIAIQNTPVYQEIVLSGIPTERHEWKPGIQAGMKKEFNITTFLRGTTIIMFNIYTPRGNNQPADIVNARIGCEVLLKEKKKLKRVNMGQYF